MQAIRLNHVILVCYCVLYFMLSLPHLYQHIQHGVSMLVFLTWYQSHLPMAMVFCFYGIFKSNLCLPRCFFSLRSSSLASYCCRQNSPVQSSHHQKSHQHCKTIAFLKLPSQSQTSFKGFSQSYQISRFHQASILSLRGGVRNILAH